MASTPVGKVAKPSLVHTEVSREHLLSKLERVAPGLSSAEFSELAGCFIFCDGYVLSYGEDLACQAELDLPIYGAVHADTLLKVLSKIPDDKVRVESNENELRIYGHKKKLGIALHQDAKLPENIVPSEVEWHEVSDDLIEAISLASSCVAKDNEIYVMTCVCLSGDYVIASDNFQILYYPCQTGVPEGEAVLVRGKALKDVPSIGATHVAFTQSWVHFKDSIEGTVYSLRRVNDQYPDLLQFLNVEGQSVVLPKNIVNAADRAALLSKQKLDDEVIVELQQGRAVLRGEGIHGWYEEEVAVDYAGPSMKFSISPALLQRVLEHGTRCTVQGDRMLAEASKFKYLVCLGVEEEDGVDEQVGNVS